MHDPVVLEVRRCAAVLAAALLWVGCGDDGSGGVMQCLEPLDLECAPAFKPTFDELYDRHFGSGSSCAGGGPSCHGADGQQAGLDLSEREQAYQMLLGHVDGRARVIEGEPECSILIQRLESEDDNFVMPQGMRLDEPQRCAFRLWVANGAHRSEP